MRIPLFAAGLLFLASAAPAAAQSSINARQIVQNGQALDSGLNLPSLRQTLTVSPTGNATGAVGGVQPLATLASVHMFGSTVSNTNREFLLNYGMDSVTGGSTTSGFGNDGKVLLYGGVNTEPGSGDTWAANLLNGLLPGAACTGSVSGGVCYGRYISGQTLEVDFNNLSGHHFNDDMSNITRPFTGAMTIAGVGAYRQSAALGIDGAGQRVFNRGVTIFPGSISTAGGSFVDYDSGQNASIWIHGAPTNGILQDQPGVQNYLAGSLTVSQVASFNGTLTAAQSSTAANAPVVYLRNVSTANNTSKSIGVEFDLSDTVGSNKVAAKLIARLGDGNAVTAGLAVQVRRSGTVVDHIVFNADGTTTLPSPAADPAAPTTGSIWFRSDIGTIRASGDLAATGVLKAQGGLQFGGAASRGLYADPYNFAVRTPGTGYVYIQTEGGTSNYAVFGPPNSLFNPPPSFQGAARPRRSPPGATPP